MVVVSNNSGTEKEKSAWKLKAGCSFLLMFLYGLFLPLPTCTYSHLRSWLVDISRNKSGEVTHFNLFITIFSTDSLDR